MLISINLFFIKEEEKKHANGSKLNHNLKIYDHTKIYLDKAKL